MEILSKFISWVFIPLLTPIYALLIAMYFPVLTKDFYQENSLFILPDEGKTVLLYLFTAFSFVAPALTILFLQTQGKLKSVMMEDRSERILPAALVVLYAISLFTLLLYKVPETLPGSRFLFGLSLGSLLTVLITTVLTLKWKVSLHSAGMGILTGFVFAYDAQMSIFNMPLLLALFVASGVVMSARMYLKLHTLSQLLIGFFIGFLALLISVAFFFIP
jgi:membrane-associated phospholipid phosphatase